MRGRPCGAPAAIANRHFARSYSRRFSGESYYRAPCYRVEKAAHHRRSSASIFEKSIGAFQIKAFTQARADPLIQSGLKFVLFRSEHEDMNLIRFEEEEIIGILKEREVETSGSFQRRDSLSRKKATAQG
jgi:hypothetical protein